MLVSGQTAQRRGAVAIKGGDQGTPGSGTLCHGLDDKVVISKKLNLMISEVFSVILFHSTV